jgi:hypothetical protein
LQKPASKAADEVIGCGDSRPMMDQVPEDSQRLSPWLIGMPATAEAVSCEADAITGISALPM